MAAFSSFLDILPDPSNPIGEAGQSLSTGSGGVAGPGFASVKFTSEQPSSISRTNSGKVISRAIVGQRWKIQISYNPMTREQFEPVYAFLQEKRGRLQPFFVILPQYSSPRDSTLNRTITNNAAISAGDNHFVAAGFGSGNGELKVGDMININDSNNSTHKKAYQITRVMTNSNYLTGGTQPTSSQRLYYVSPHFEKSVASGQSIVYTNPKFRVIQTADVREYDLGNNNLYQFSLSLEEAQP